jgi:hypothetical protein
MNSFKVEVIDGPLPEDFAARGEMEPRLTTAPHLAEVARELMRREPLFHRPESGSTRADFEKMTAPEFWEVGASGRRYSRAFVLDTLEQRYQNPVTDTWEIQDFHCAELAAETFLVTYTLLQGARATRRSTIWKRTPDSWKILYHQGTLCAAD